MRTRRAEVNKAVIARQRRRATYADQLADGAARRGPPTRCTSRARATGHDQRVACPALEGGGRRRRGARRRPPGGGTSQVPPGAGRCPRATVGAPVIVPTPVPVPVPVPAQN